MPGEHSDIRIKPLPLINGHGRHMAVTPERTRGRAAVSKSKRPPGSGSDFKHPPELLESPMRDSFQGGHDQGGTVLAF